MFHESELKKISFFLFNFLMKLKFKGYLVLNAQNIFFRVAASAVGLFSYSGNIFKIVKLGTVLSCGVDLQCKLSS